MLHRNVLAVVCLFCVSLFAPGASAADWNQWRGPNRDGLAPNSPALIDSLPAAGLKPLWISKPIPSGNSGGWSSPIVVGSRAYLFTHSKKLVGEKLGRQKFPYLSPDKRVGMSGEEYEKYEQNRRDEQEERALSYQFTEIIFCLDINSGKVVWENELNSVYTRFSQSGTPAVADGGLYILGAGRKARCVDIQSGKDLWATNLPGEFRDEFLQASMVIVDGVAIAQAGRLFGLDVKTGEILWAGEEEKTYGDHSSPAFWRHAGQSHVLVNVAGGDTICVDPKTGREQWRVKSEGGRATPVVVGDRMLTYGGSRKKGLRCFALSASGAELLWKFQGASDPGSSPVVIEGRVFVQGERRLACLELENGKRIWQTTLNLGRPRYTSLAAADGKVFYTFDNVLCFSARGEKYQPLINAKIDDVGLMAEEEDFRKLLEIDKLESTSEGQKQAQRIWRKKFRGGPLPCSSPAIVNGRLYLRLRNTLACYDLTTQSGN